MNKKCLPTLLSPKERTLYLGLLAAPGRNLTDLARRTGIDRATAFRLIARLEAQGLAFSLNRGRRRVWLGKSPEHLTTSVNQELKLLQLLFQQRAHRGTEPKIQYLDRPATEKFVRSIILKSRPGEELLCYMPPAGIFSVFQEQTQAVRALRLRAKKRVLVKAIMSRVEIEPLVKAGEDWTRYRIVKLIDHRRFPLSAFFQVWRNTVMVGTAQGEWLVIEQREIANTLRAIFHFTWAALKQQYQPPSLPARGGILV